MTPVVLDASVALAWVLPTEGTDQLIALRNRARDAPALVLLVPPTFWLEVANALWVAVRRGRLDAVKARAALTSLQAFSIETWQVDAADCLDLAFDRNLPVYDTAYLSAAGEAECPLWTADGALSRAATATGVHVEP